MGLLTDARGRVDLQNARKVIVTCAVTGSIHVPTMSPYLPITPDEIADSAVEAAEAGAGMLHLHARDPVDGRPSPDPDLFVQFAQRIKQRCDAVINITTGGGLGMTLDERLAAPLQLQPEICTLNMGSMNYGLFPVQEKIGKFRHDWESEYLGMTRDFVFTNTYAGIERIIVEIGQAFDTRFEFECYDVGHLYNLGHFLDRGLVEPPLFIQTVFGIFGGIAAAPENLLHMKHTADRLFGDDYVWSVLAAGRHQMSYVTMGAIMGGNVRVGLEDNLYLGKNTPARSNAQQVERVRTILENLSLEIATPEEVRAMLKLKGADAVAF